ncbi:hypothetical protein INT45_013134 [Circinella minor]|uniref:Uncharacterized protein n=1 Tax=Circinella minor TaxID=1195481 RepID=A0A8H7VJF3_9FUNG|nr:hypothetical protein INT45_013134 [Circinella minor]
MATTITSSATSIISMITYIFFAPIMAAILSILGLLAVITSIMTSSFISIRLFLLATEFGLGLTLNSASRIFSWLKARLRQLAVGGGTMKERQKFKNINLVSLAQQQEPSIIITDEEHSYQLFTKPNFISLPHRTPIKNIYSKSVPNTPDPSKRVCHQEFTF